MEHNPDNFRKYKTVAHKRYEIFFKLHFFMSCSDTFL